MKKFKSAAMALYLGIAGAVLAATPANAVLVNYVFSGTTDGSLTLSGTTTPIAAGTAFTATGMTVSDVEAFAFAGFGFYPSMTTYNFTGVGSFTSDATSGEFLFHNCAGFASISCTGLIDLGFSYGFQADHASIAVSPDLGAVPLGGPLTPSGSNANGPGSITNSSGDTLSFGNTVTISSLTVTAKIAEPGTLAILGFGLMGLGLARRRKAAA